MRGILLLSLCGVVLLTAAVFLSSTLAAGIFPALNDVAFRTLHNHAEDNASRLSSEFNMVSRAARLTANDLQSSLQELLAGHTVDQLQGDGDTLDQLLEAGCSSIEVFLNNQAATGAFVMLNAGYVDGDSRACIYLRDMNPGTLGGEDGDLTLLRGALRLVAGRSKPSLEKDWSLEQPTADETDSRYFLSPQEAALQYPKAGNRDWGYWSEPFKLSRSDLTVITYTVPLLDSAKQPIGVFGVELSARYVAQLMPPENLPFDRGFYLMTLMDGEAVRTDVAMTANTRGSIFVMNNPQALPSRSVKATQDYQVFSLGQESEMYMSRASLDLYGSNSPFYEGQYQLLAMAPKELVLETSRSITRGIVISLAVAMAVAMVCAIVLSRSFAKRIENLAQQVAQGDPERPLSLLRTNIREVDELGESLEQMSADLIRYAARMSNIVDLVGIAIGAFELQELSGRVFLTDSLFRMLERDSGGSNYMDVADFLELFPGVTLPDQSDQAFEVELPWIGAGELLSERWLRVRALRQESMVYGVMIDITEEVRQRRWLEYERDFDPLTRLYNRNSYPLRMTHLIREAPDRHGVLLFGDLDNLKSINDTYGHDMGDRYIQLTAQALRRFEDHGGVVARISGDEFAVYLHGASSRRDLRQMVDRILLQVRDEYMVLPDGNRQSIRISVGLAYYPRDARDIETLVRYADFAMYEIKHSIKGTTREFDAASYAQKSEVLNKPTQLDRFIEGRRMRFAFQPIIDAATGEVFGYEALMRPQMREIHTPGEILKLAKAQDKLDQIEHLTLSHAMEWLQENRRELGGRRLFVNLIADQTLSQEDLEQLSKLIPELDGRMIVEIRYDGGQDQELLTHKVSTLRKTGLQVALDDFGGGTPGSSVTQSLRAIEPDFIKIDLSLVHNIQSDSAGQELLRQTLDHAREQGSIVIAEGVEREAELETLLAAGVRYVQGFFFGQPEFTLDQHNRAACARAAELYRRIHR